MSRKRDTRKFDELRLRRLKAFGGPLLRKAKHRTSRPITSKSPMHLVLKSSKAKGSWSFLHVHHQKKLRLMILQYGRKYRIKIRELSFANEVIHMLIAIRSKNDYLKFIRTITCAIAMKISKMNRLSHRDKKTKSKLKFWDFRPLTTVAESRWGSYKKILGEFKFLIESTRAFRLIEFDRRVTFHFSKKEILII